MLGFLRRVAGTWPARLLFIVLVAAFGLWGIGGATRAGLSDPESVASVGGVRITRVDLENAYNQELARVSQMMPDPSQVPPAMRAGLMRQTLDELVVGQAVINHAYALGLAAPDEWVRRTVFAIPAFQDASGHFDHAQLDRLLTTRRWTEAHFLDLVREDLVQRQLIEQVRVGAAAPEELTRRIFGFAAEQRVAQIASLPFGAVPPPAPPAPAVLQRWYDNHPDDYARPEYRRIRLVILDADTIARTISVPEADVRAAYAAQRASFDNDGTRSVQVVSAPNQAAAAAIATAWRGQSADPAAAWAAVQKQAQALGGAAADLSTVTRAQMPSEALAAPVFGATEGSVVGPVNTPLGWQVARVSGIVPGRHQSYDDVKASLAQQIAQTRAADQLDGAADKLQDKLASGAGLDEIPADAGAAAVEGTLDASGLTQDGEPAPVPAKPDARAQIIAKAFATAKGAPTQLTQIPGAVPPGAPAGTPPSGPVWYAVQVESITPPAQRPYAEVAAKVLTDWRHDAVRHTQETAAAGLLAALRAPPATRPTLDVAARRAGITPTLTPPISRSGTTPGVPMELARAVFALHPGEASMVETADGFTVASLARIIAASPAEQQRNYDRVAARLTQSLGNDVEQAYAGAVRDRAAPSINQAALDQLSQPQ